MHVILILLALHRGIDVQIRSALAAHLQSSQKGAGLLDQSIVVDRGRSLRHRDCLFKLADVEQRLGNTAKAKGILQQVVQQYPGSSAAQLAQRDLQRLP